MTYQKYHVIAETVESPIPESVEAPSRRDRPDLNTIGKGLFSRMTATLWPWIHQIRFQTQPTSFFKYALIFAVVLNLRSHVIREVGLSYDQRLQGARAGSM